MDDAGERPTPSIPAGGADEGLRGEIFTLLVHEADKMTPSEIGAALDTTRQSVQYHLSTLVDAHLVINDGGEYYVQPLFIDPEFEEAFEEALAGLVPHAESKLYIGEDAEDPPERIILDCLRVAMSMQMLPDDGT
jgi:uncharacterized protein (DUF736 family)